MWHHQEKWDKVWDVIGKHWSWRRANKMSPFRYTSCPFRALGGGKNLHWLVTHVQSLRELSCVLSLRTPFPSEQLRHLPSQQAEECICFSSSVIMEQRGCHPNINICLLLHSSPAFLTLETILGTGRARMISPHTNWTSSYVYISISRCCCTDFTSFTRVKGASWFQIVLFFFFFSRDKAQVVHILSNAFSR